MKITFIRICINVGKTHWVRAIEISGWTPDLDDQNDEESDSEDEECEEVFKKDFGESDEEVQGENDVSRVSDTDVEEENPKSKDEWCFLENDVENVEMDNQKDNCDGEFGNVNNISDEVNFSSGFNTYKKAGGESMDSDHCRESEGSQKGGPYIMLMDELLRWDNSWGKYGRVYEDLLQDEVKLDHDSSCPKAFLTFPHHLNSMQQLDLEAEVSNEEIKKAVWDCGVDKSPGPDGFTFGFYKRFWSLIEKDVLAAVKYFFHYSRIPKGCNSSFIALIPKTPEAKMVKDFRPISLIGSLYKIITKILANRLVVVLGDIVNEVQSAFVADRQILDGPFILNEVLQWCKLKKKHSFILKIDFEKAYDSVRWDYLDDVLRKFGFGEKWCGWIQECLRSSWGSVLVNGSPTEEFQFFKGLKQGDPLSPFIFILVMESLHISFKRVVDAGMFNGIVLNSVMHLSHIAYVLVINLSKSKLLGVVVSEDRVVQAANRIGCGVLKAPFAYLGSKVGGNMSRIKSWDEIMDKMVDRLSKWKMKTLSIGGRLTLLKAVLGSMPIYHMSIFKVDNEISLQRMEFKWLQVHLAKHSPGGGNIEDKRFVLETCFETMISLALCAASEVDGVVASKTCKGDLTWSFRRAPFPESATLNSMDKCGVKSGHESFKSLFFYCLVAEDIFAQVVVAGRVDFMEVHTFDDWVSWIQEEEFLTFKQGNQLVTEYTANFVDMARFAEHLVVTGERKIERSRDVNESNRGQSSTREYYAMLEARLDSSMILYEGSSGSIWKARFRTSLANDTDCSRFDVGHTSISSTVDPNSSAFYAKLFIDESSRKSVNFRILITSAGNGTNVAIPLESIRAISERFVNTTYGFFLRKRVTYLLVANYVRNTWGKYGVVKSMFNSSTELFFFQFSSMGDLDSLLANEDVVNVPVWVKLYGVPVTAFSEDCLSAIAIGKLVLVDDDGKLLENVDYLYNSGCDDELQPVNNEIASFLASKPMGFGYGPESLLEQWRKNEVDEDYKPYDDDMYEGQKISGNIQNICDNLDIKGLPGTRTNVASRTFELHSIGWVVSPFATVRSEIDSEVERRKSMRDLVDNYSYPSSLSHKLIQGSGDSILSRKDDDFELLVDSGERMGKKAGIITQLADIILHNFRKPKDSTLSRNSDDCVNLPYQICQISDSNPRIVLQFHKFEEQCIRHIDESHVVLLALPIIQRYWDWVVALSAADYPLSRLLLLRAWVKSNVSDLWNMIAEYSSQRTKKETAVGFFNWLTRENILIPLDAWHESSVGEESHLAIETNSHEATKENHWLHDGTYLMVLWKLR
ncbi:RNA-directed DNA polymerase, eukaryota [Tanacetum coccineum]